MHRHVHIREDGVDSLSKSRTQAHSGGYHSVSATGDTSSPAKSYSDDAGLMGGRSFIAGIMRRLRVWNAEKSITWYKGRGAYHRTRPIPDSAARVG